MDLDDISSDSLGSEASPHDFKVTLLYDSEVSDTPVGSIVFSSDEDAPLNFGQEDRRKVRKRDPRPMNQPRPTDIPAYEPTPRERPVDVPGYEPTPRERPVDVPTYEPTPRERPTDVPAYEPTPRERPVDVPTYEPTPRERPTNVPAYEQTPRERPADGSSYEPTLSYRHYLPVDDLKSEPTPKKRPVDPKNVPLIYFPPPPADLPEWSDSEVMPLIIIENSSAVEKPRTTDRLLPVDSEIVLPQSPEVTSFEDQEALSAPLSPNRVRKGHSPGFNMRPAGGGVQATEITQPSSSNYVGFNNPFFGAPIAFAQCHNTSGMDTTTTVPIYSIPKDSNIGIDQSSVPTVFASGVSPDSIPWSTAEDIIRDIVREGPFDAGATPMENGGQSFNKYEHARLPVPNDIIHGNSYHHPRFLEFIGAPESARLLNHSPSFWVDRLGQKSAMAAAMNLQRDAGFMMSNLQILAQFVMSLHRMSSEMLSIGVDHVVFPVEEVDKLSVMPMAQRAAKYMTAMGLWRSPSGPGAPGPLPTSTCPSCMNCEYCFGRKETSNH